MAPSVNSSVVSRQCDPIGEASSSLLSQPTKERHMKRYSTMMALFAMTTLIGTTAFAGYRWGSPVIIDTAARTAQGTMGTVRSSADSVQSIGCAVRASTGGSSAAVYCYATDSA